MLRYLTWPSKETSPRLTSDEVNTLIRFTYDVMQAGHLTEGKYVGATTALYWERLKGDN